MTTADVSRESVDLVVREVLAVVLPSSRPARSRATNTCAIWGPIRWTASEIVLMLLDRLHLDEPMSSFSQLPDIDALAHFSTRGATDERGRGVATSSRHRSAERLLRAAQIPVETFVRPGGS